MNTTNLNNLRQFYSVVNRKHLNRDVFNYLLKEWNLDGIDLEIENEKVKSGISKLSRSKRDAIKEFLILKSILNEVEKTEAKESKENIEEEIQFN